MRNGRFPLISTLIALALAGSVVYLSYMDVDVPSKAFAKIGEAVSQLGGSIRVLSNSIAEDGGGIVFTDNGRAPLPLLVNEQNPVPDDFSPTSLVRMRDYCDTAVVTIKGSEIEGEREAVDALMEMLRAAIAEGISDWQINAGYRSVAYQQQLWDNRVYEYRQQGLSGAQAQSATAQYVAKPGCSEHHTGLAFDVTVPGESFPLTIQSKWLAENCWTYGFIIRYTEEKQPITGINAEPWHIRYVGQPHATTMRENNWCLEEYIDSLL